MVTTRLLTGMAASGYECDLRRLFRPPVDHLPVSEQLSRYRQRDLLPSHLYRLGTHLFGSHPPRRRVIDASLSTPHERTPHAHLLNRSWDGRIRAASSPSANASNVSTQGYPHEASPAADLDLAEKKAEDMSEDDYRQWISRRRGLRSRLDTLGASEAWLCSKERTPLEVALLSRLRSERRAASRETAPAGATIEVDQAAVGDHSSPSDADVRRRRQRLKRDVLRETALLEKFILLRRQQIVGHLLAADQKRERKVTVDNFLAILSKLRTPVSSATIDTLLSSIEVAPDNSFDYTILLNGSLLSRVEEYFQRREVDTVVAEAVPQRNPCLKSASSVACTVGSTHSGSDTGDSREEEPAPTRLESLQRRHKVPSSMEGETGRLVDAYKRDSLDEFTKLIEHCQASNIVLTWELAERALLLPPDRTRRECQAGLRQPGLDLLSGHFADPSSSEDTEQPRGHLRATHGGAYLELRGRGKSKFTRLSTGPARVKAKTDCWMSYDEFQRLTERIRARPGFSYKYHGLPDNSAFWPGALRDKLRLWMPSETLLDKPYSLCNVFQLVQHPKVTNPFSPMVEQRTSWPDNDCGYVQFGSQNRKKYSL